LKIFGKLVKFTLEESFYYVLDDIDDLDTIQMTIAFARIKELIFRLSTNTEDSLFASLRS
jgi:hypothetical protein